MADIIISIASKVAGCLVAPIGRQLGYLSNYHNNLDDLKIQLDKLKVVKDGVEQYVYDSTRNGEVVKPGVENWRKKVDGITQKAGEILLENEDKAKKRCLNGLCPNLKLRYQLSKKAKKTTEKIVVEIQDGEEKLNEGVSHRPPPQGTIGSTRIKDYEDFESRMSTLKEIMEALRNPNINMIGVYGMGGVGKTMLVKEVARKAKEDKLFDEVVMAVVSQPPNIRKIQEEIAYPLGLKFEPLAIDCERVDRLCGRLKQEKSILIILDDVWAQLDLEAIGIPSGDIHKGCKIVVTSRRLELLSNQMNIQRNFKIEELHKEEAWNLFKKMAGDSVEAPEIKPTALKVAKECAGLPIAIAVVATALKNRSPFDWKTALHQLETAAPTTIEEMDESVYKSLRLSYNYLKSEAQKLFLLCSLLPEDYQFSIQELLYYGKGVGLFQGQALEMARNIVHTLVNHLKDSCLLLDGYTSGLFKMHDVVRDVGISVASKDKKMLIVRNKFELEEWMTEEQLKSLSAISLPYIDIDELPTGFESPALKFFLFYSRLKGSSKIPDSFFGGMKQLKVLTLRNIEFSSLHFPSSLQTLCLDECKLPDISIIGELKKLEILTFRHSDIEELPREIGQLTRLKLLDLRDCRALKVIPSNVIGRLSQLEELYVGGSFNRWQVDGNASLAELKHLSRLVTLEIYIRDANILPNDLAFENLTRYQIVIGDFQYFQNRSDDYEISRTLKLKVNTSIDLLSVINKLLERTEDLHLEELNGFKSILNDSDGEGFHDTRHLHVESSSEIEYVMDKSVPFSAFPKLESLSLVKLINLKEICHGQLTAEDNNGAVYKIMFPQLRSLTLRELPKLVSFCSKVKAVPCTSDAGSREIISISEGEHGISVPLFNEKDTFPNLEYLHIAYISMKEIWHSQLLDGSFCNLRSVRVEYCDRLQNLFPLSVATRLSKLQEIRIWSCKNMDGIVAEDNNGALFPQLWCLELQQMPKLVSFCSKVKEVPCTSDAGSKEIISISEGEHGISIPLFNEKDTFPNLEYLNILSISMKEIWHSQLPDGSFCNLRNVYVARCNRLQNLFPLSVARRLSQLQELEINLCKNMDGIVAEYNNGAVFPQLRSLKLWDLPELVSFYSKVKPMPCTSDAGSKEIISISEGEHGISIPLFNQKAAFPNLEELFLMNLPRLMAVWMKDSQGSLNIQNLSSLYIGDCESLINVFTTSMAQFQDMVEETNEKEAAAIDKIMFPQVKSLTLKCLKQLKSFCEWIHISEWPSLKKLKMSGCDNVEIFASELSTFKEIRGKANLGTPTKQPFFLVDKVAFPNLEEMKLNDMSNMEVIWQGQFHAQSSFRKLRVLTVKKCNKILKVFPISLLRNLENLSVEDCCSLEDVFKLERGVGKTEHASTFPPLKELRLIGLPKLMHLWKEDSQLSAVFQNLKTLEVRSCGSLTHVFPSTRAESPVQIESTTDVSDKGKATDETTFSQLYSLKLKDLSNLTSFCPGSKFFFLPSLKKVLVEECPKLKTFSSNTLHTPKLEKVLVTEDKRPLEMNEWLWDGDLNTTIQHLFKQNMESIPFPMQGVWSNDPASQLEATTQFRKLLSIERGPSIDKVIKAGVVRRFVEFLGRQDLPQLQFEAAWALTNVASGTSEHTRVVIERGAVPKFVQLLSSANDCVREQAVWALGNVARDSPSCRDLVLGHGALMPLLAQLNEHSKLSMLRNATWTLSNLCCGTFEQVKPALPVLRQLIHLNDEEVLTDACWALSNLSDGPNYKIQAVIEAGVCPRLMELLRQPSPTVLEPALRTVGNIVTGDDTQTQFVIDNQVLPCLYQLLTQNLEKSITEYACRTIANITAGNRDQIQAVIEANIILPLVHQLQHEEFDIKEEAAWAISNATSGGSHEQIQFLVSQGCIKPLCDLLVCPDPKIVQVCLKGLKNILKVSEADKEVGLNGGINLYAQMIDECEGLDKLENLQTHDNNKISKKAVKLLRRYWAEKDDKVQNPQDG